ncbi:hypothetical protein Leryth_012910 [Lithospermum erythrorhizon]|nr:hypothetical protein Leryth_012910 [Lithospermum erythrorhizon]
MNLANDRFDNATDGEGRGVKEDLSELTETLSRQFRGVASFLAPSFYKSDDFNVRDVIGVTEEALAFAHNIAHHPETWLDFPIGEGEDQDFQVSDSQYKHALAIQHLVPTLAALRIELCPVHMSEGYFWMVYFVLLHSRLDKVVADQLSSAELVQARSRWREELQKRAKPNTDWFGRSTSYLHENSNSPRDDFDPQVLENYEPGHISFNTYNDGYRPYHDPADYVSEKQIVECGEANPAENPSGNSERDLLSFQSAQILQDQDDEDDWVQDTEELDGYSATGIGLNEEDVSFSDLEEDSDWTLPIKSK